MEYKIDKFIMKSNLNKLCLNGVMQSLQEPLMESLNSISTFANAGILQLGRRMQQQSSAINLMQQLPLCAHVTADGDIIKFS